MVIKGIWKIFADMLRAGQLDPQLLYDTLWEKAYPYPITATLNTILTSSTSVNDDDVDFVTYL